MIAYDANKMEVAKLIDMWLSRAQMHQATVVLAMATQGIVLSEKNFHQWYKNSRRGPYTDPTSAMAVVKVFAQRRLRHERCTAAEALRFLALTRFPSERLATIKPWFAPAEWRRAVQGELELLRAHLGADDEVAIHSVEQPHQSEQPFPMLDMLPLHDLNLGNILFKQGPHPVQAYFCRPLFADLCAAIQRVAAREQGGVVLFGPPMVGKTRAVLEALKQEVPDFLLFSWPPVALRAEQLSALQDQRVVLLLDDAQELVRRNVVGEVLEAVRTLQATTRSCLIVATCRSGNDEAQVRHEFGTLIEYLTAFHLPPMLLESTEHHDFLRFLAQVRQDEPEQQSDAAQFDGTPGSVFLGVQRRTVQLRSDAYFPPGAKAILKSLALLHAASITDSSEALVRRVTEGVFHTQETWLADVDYLIRAEWVRLEACGGGFANQVRVLTDAYLETCLPQAGIYPQAGRHIEEDFLALATVLMAAPADARALIRLSDTLYFADKGPISTWMECALACAQVGLAGLGTDPDLQIWGEGQLTLGRAYWRRTLGNRAENLECALTMLRNAEHACSRIHHTYEWAEVQRTLGHVLTDREQGDRADNVEQAIACYQAALQVFTQDTHPQMWARLHGNLGNAYTDRLQGNIADNREMAIAAYQAALRVYAPATTPVDWAREQVKLGEAYSQRIFGKKSANIAQALLAYTAALQVFTRHAYSFQWAFIQYDWGNAVMQVHHDEHTDTREEAIACYHAARGVLNPQDYPFFHALIAVSLGHAYRQRLVGDVVVNQEESLAWYAQGAPTLAGGTSPHHWAELQTGRGCVYLARLQGDRIINLQQARDCFTEALATHTHADYPLEWGMITDYLGWVEMALAGEGDCYSDASTGQKYVVVHPSQDLTTRNEVRDQVSSDATYRR